MRYHLSPVLAHVLAVVVPVLVLGPPAQAQGGRDQTVGERIHIRAADLPAPYATPTVGNPARRTARPAAPK